MILALILFVSSWIAGYLLYQAACVAFYDPMYGDTLNFLPFRCGAQRALTFIEVVAQCSSYRRSNSRADGTTEPLRRVELRPVWVRIAGFIVDLIFFAAVGWFFFSLFSISSSTLMLVVIAYMILGFGVFLYHLLYLGQIGMVGYHVRCLVYLALWPLFLAFVK